MRTVTYRINYGGFIGAEEEYQIEVPDDATQDDIDICVDEDFQNKVLENCSCEIVDIEEEDDV